MMTSRRASLLAFQGRRPQGPDTLRLIADGSVRSVGVTLRANLGLPIPYGASL